MAKTQRLRANRLTLQPLEARWLFSAVWPQLEPLDTSGPVVAAQVHQPLVARAGEEQEADIDPSSLPPTVRQTVSEALAGWRTLGAIIQIDENGTNYVVSAERSGTTVEFKIGQTGGVREGEQNLQVAEVPNSIRDWAETNFPGVEVAEVVRVTGTQQVSYDVTFVMANGQEFEATLQEIDSASPLSVRIPSNEIEGRRVVTETDQPVVSREPGSRLYDREQSAIENSAFPRLVSIRVTDAKSSPTEDPLVAQEQADQRVTEQDALEPSLPAAHSIGFINAVGPAASIVRAIRDWVSFDGDAVERSFSQFLHSLDQLMLGEPGGGWRDRAYQVLPAISILVGVQTFALKSLRRKRPELTRLDER